MTSTAALLTILNTTLLLSVGLAIGGWAALDARSRGSQHPILWAVFGPLSVVLLFYYVGFWRRHHDRESPPSQWEWRAAIVGVVGLGTLIGTALVFPSDPVTQMLYWPVIFACCLPLVYWFLQRR